MTTDVKSIDSTEILQSVPNIVEEIDDLQEKVSVQAATIAKLEGKIDGLMWALSTVTKGVK